MRAVVLAMDVGGTAVKSALVGASGTRVPGTFRRTRIASQGPQEAILGALVGAAKGAQLIAKDAAVELRGIGLGLPGPCDYRSGVSLMRHKFQAIYGVPLGAVLRERLALDDAMVIRFEHDAAVFLIGEVWLGAAQGYERALGITLGTGLGCACTVRGALVTSPSGLPLYSIWNQPYRGGIVEDVVSARGILTRYRELTGGRGTAAMNVRALARAATGSGDAVSRRVFREFGSELGRAIRQTVEQFRPDAVVCGGQISKSFSLFADGLKAALAHAPGLRAVVQARSVDFSALRGAAKLVFDSFSPSGADG